MPAQAALLELQCLRVAHRDDAALPGGQVAQVQGVAQILVFLPHERGLVFGPRLLIARLGPFFGDHRAIQALAAQLHFNAQQDGAPGQGKV
ncbi:hypothetical protein POHY109586_22455 [Polaromonas hydrogenivorans]